jgi:streptogramin lyase
MSSSKPSNTLISTLLFPSSFRRLLPLVPKCLIQIQSVIFLSILLALKTESYQGRIPAPMKTTPHTSHIYISESVHSSVVQFNGFSEKNRTSYGRQGMRDEEGKNILDEVSSIGVDNKERIYIADRNNNRIIRIDDMKGSNWVSMRLPQSVASIFVMPSGRIYILLDRNLVGQTYHLLRMEDMTGRGQIDMTLAEGSGPRQLNAPHAIFVDSQERIYITDTNNHRIVRMQDMQGNGWVTLGSAGTGRMQFWEPMSLYVTVQGQVYVADRELNRIVRFDDMAGKGWITFSGNRDYRLSSPCALCIGVDNRIYLGESAGRRIVRMDDIQGHNLSVLKLSTHLVSPSTIIVR